MRFFFVHLVAFHSHYRFLHTFSVVAQQRHWPVTLRPRIPVLALLLCPVPSSVIPSHDWCCASRLRIIFIITSFNQIYSYWPSFFASKIYKFVLGQVCQMASTTESHLYILRFLWYPIHKRWTSTTWVRISTILFYWYQMKVFPLFSAWILTPYVCVTVY